MLTVPVSVFSRRVLSVVISGSVALAALMVDTGAAEAKSRKKHHKRHYAGSSYTPPYAAMVVDANTGRVLHANQEHALRHPASVTKVMTLYMLFEQMEKGRFALDDEIEISRHAASMSPSKLGLRPGATISVEDAIKAIVTKSANDIAAAVGEAVGGSEERFAQLMTAKAQSLGMSRTFYANASGLPDARQVTTAHDLVILGRSIQERFPKYYGYFSTHQFTFRGKTMGNHNRLLGQVEGMDGIKTGYTNASGFNLLSSVKRGNRRIISVVLGGKSAAGRDRIMANLIAEHLDSASPNKTTMVARAEETAAPKLAPMASAYAPPAPVPAVAPLAEKAKPAVIANPSRSPEDRTASIPAAKVSDGSTRQVAATASTSQVTPGGGARKPAAPAAQARAPEKQAAVAAKAEPARPAAAMSGYMIQVGATDAVSKANDLLAKARSKAPALSGATPFTEKVKKGSETIYRARFAGLTDTKAEAACKSLKRSGLSCFTTKN